MSVVDPISVRLERRYRRLFAWFPADFQARYAEEMLAVAMARSRPGQRRPEPCEAANLVVSGLALRLLRPLRRGGASALGPAAAAFTTLSSILLAGLVAQPVLARLAWSMAPGYAIELSHLGAAFVVGWVLVAAARLLGWRLVAAVGATVGLIGGVASLSFDAYATSTVVLCWSALTAVTAWIDVVQGADKTVAGGLGRLASGLTAGAAVLYAAASAVDILFVPGTVATGYYSIVTTSNATEIVLPGRFGWLGGDLVVEVGRVVAIGLVAVVMARLTAPTRRRVLVLLGGLGAAVALPETRFLRLVQVPVYSAIDLTAAQWTVVALVLAAVVAIGLALVGRFEGRRQPVPAPAPEPNGPTPSAPDS